MVDKNMEDLAREITTADPQIRMRIGVVTGIEASGSRRLQTDQTETAWLNCDKDTAFTIGDRVWMIQQGGVFVVAGRLSGEPSGVPIGTILAYAGSVPPAGWITADGAAISRSTYNKLYAIVGNGYGAGNGTTTFNIPDLGAKFPIGAKGLSPFLTTTGGAETVALTTANLPAHDHGSAGAHSHLLDNVQGMFVTGGGAVGAISSGSGGIYLTSTNGAHTHASVGSGTAHNNMPPYLAINYIIRVL